MGQYVGLDVAMKETVICIIDETGQIAWRGRCASHPEAIAKVIRRRAPTLVRVGLETGALTTWLWHGLTEAGLPVVCLDARHAKAALSLKINKTDENDAEGLAQIVRTGWYREVRVKSWNAMFVRNLLGARAQLVAIATDLTNQIRGILKTFGLTLGKGGGRVFEAAVRRRVAEWPGLERIVLPLLEAWRVVRARAAALDRDVRAVARRDATCKLLMTGIGAVTAVAFVAAVEDPTAFKNSRAVGAWLGLTQSRYQTGETDIAGRISKRGDGLVRTYLYEAAHVVLHRVRTDSALRRWGLALQEKIGGKRATVAVARKLAVLLHAMWKSNTRFRPYLVASAAA